MELCAVTPYNSHTRHTQQNFRLAPYFLQTDLADSSEYQMWSI